MLNYCNPLLPMFKIQCYCRSNLERLRKMMYFYMWKKGVRSGVVTSNDSFFLLYILGLGLSEHFMLYHYWHLLLDFVLHSLSYWLLVAYGWGEGGGYKVENNTLQDQKKVSAVLQVFISAFYLVSVEKYTVSQKSLCCGAVLDFEGQCCWTVQISKHYCYLSDIAAVTTAWLM